jgi:hypothetical protein
MLLHAGFEPFVDVAGFEKLRFGGQSKSSDVAMHTERLKSGADTRRLDSIRKARRDFRPTKAAGGHLHFDAFPWLQDRNLRFAFGEAGELFRITNQRRKCAVVDRNHELWMEEFDGFGCVLWSHNEMFANG